MAHVNGVALYRGVLVRSLHIAFYSVLVLNAGGLLVLLLAAFNTIPSVFTPAWLRLPVLVCLAGIAFAFMGLFWTHLVNVSLLAQSLVGKVRRGHWLPMLCVTISYGLSLIAFVLACWLSFALAGVASVYENAAQTLPDGHPPISPRRFVP